MAVNFDPGRETIIIQPRRHLAILEGAVRARERLMEMRQIWLGPAIRRVRLRQAHRAGPTDESKASISSADSRLNNPSTKGASSTSIAAYASMNHRRVRSARRASYRGGWAASSGNTCHVEERPCSASSALATRSLNVRLCGGLHPKMAISYTFAMQPTSVTRLFIARNLPALSTANCGQCNHTRDKMTNPMKLGAVVAVLGLMVAPAFAQNAASHNTMSAPAAGHAGNTSGTVPSERNGVMTDNGEARTSKVVGSSVYNDKDENVGSINDLVIGKDGKVSAILSVGGFLGMGTKYVEVPYSNLAFGNTQNNSDNRVVLKGATKDSLKSQPAYSYYKP